MHLATHGVAFSSEGRARDSFMALAPDSENDGLLTVGEVLDELPALKAELVVLSACQTGLGSLTQAEGTVGLQRAFLAMGARSVLVSLWSVSDAATEALMRAFYTHWLDDADGPNKPKRFDAHRAMCAPCPGSSILATGRRSSWSEVDKGYDDLTGDMCSTSNTSMRSRLISSTRWFVTGVVRGAA